MHDDHVGENAELYALGELAPLEAARLERHARTCDDCARRIGEAEEAVLALISLEPVSGDIAPAPRFVAPSRTPAWIAAVAAAFVIGLIPWSVVSLRPSAGLPPGDAQSAMLAGHFLHAPFVAVGTGAPAAKVIYAREGGWLYVIAAAGAEPLDVAVVRNGTRTSVATLDASERTRSAFVPYAGPVDAVVLLDRGTAVASARIVYPSSKER